MHVLAVNCKDLRTLILRECHWLSAEGLTVIALNCRQLQSVDMTGCWNVNDEAITVLVMSCKRYVQYPVINIKVMPEIYHYKSGPKFMTLLVNDLLKFQT